LGVLERVAEETKKKKFSKNFIAMIKAVCILPKPNLGSTSQSSGLFMAVIIKADLIWIVLNVILRVAST